MYLRSLSQAWPLLSTALLAPIVSCSDDAAPDSHPAGSGGSAGTSGGGSAGSAGTPGWGGSSAGSAGASAGGSSSGGSSNGGSSGTGQAGSPAGGTGGSSGGSGGSGGALPDGTALANILPTEGNDVTGTATFTQNGASVTLVVSLTNCPEGDHAMHLHLNKDCGDNGDAAGGHWVPEGEVIGDIECAADGTGMLSITPEDGTWTIGAPEDSDVTTHAVMVHANPNQPDAGGRIGCGLINER